MEPASTAAIPEGAIETLLQAESAEESSSAVVDEASLQADSAQPESESIGERVARAFSLKRNLRALFVPSDKRLRPLDGWRALSILWLVVFHAGWYIGRHVPVPVYASLVFSPWMLPVWRGNFGVDVFFVLSGFLIAGMLIDERTRRGRIGFIRFYGRRLMRLWPALGVAVLASVIFTDDHPESVWANLFYVSNFVPILHAAMAWTWSLSIEEQFYLVCPWLVALLGHLRSPWRILAVSLLAVALCVIGARVITAGRFHAVDFEVVVNRPFLKWARGYDHVYVKPWMRAGPLLMGVLSAYVFRVDGAMKWFEKHRAFAVLCGALALAIAVLATHWPVVVGAPRIVEVLYLAVFRTAFGASVAYGILFSLSLHPVGKALGRLLSSRILYPFAVLAYSAYLLNPLATTLVNQALAPMVLAHGLPPLAVLLPFDALATFVAAMILHVAVEKPFMELRGH